MYLPSWQKIASQAGRNHSLTGSTTSIIDLNEAGFVDSTNSLNRSWKLICHVSWQCHWLLVGLLAKCTGWFFTTPPQHKDMRTWGIAARDTFWLMSGCSENRQVWIWTVWSNAKLYVFCIWENAALDLIRKFIWGQPRKNGHVHGTVQRLKSAGHVSTEWTA